MVLVVALPELALAIGELLEGPRNYIVSVEGPKDLRHRIYREQPEIVVLDWRIGGSGWRAVDEVTAIADRTHSQPYVIVIVPKLDRKIAAEAAKRDCYNMVVFNEKKLKAFEADLVSALEVAHAARRAREVAPRRSPKGGYH